MANSDRSQQRIRKILQLVPTRECNLSCVYCYEKDKDASARTPVDVAKGAMSDAFCDEPLDELEIHFHGGEPFVAFHEMREMCEWLWEAPRPKPYICLATTNGTFIHGDIKEWVSKNRERFILSLSLDGTREMQNLNRSSSFDKIDLDFFYEAFPSQPIKMTLSRLTLPMLADGIIFLHRRGFTLTCNHAYGIDWREEDVHMFADQLRKLCDFYLQNPRIEPCSIAAMQLAQMSSVPPVSKWCGAGTSMTCIDRFGRRYPCHMFLESPYSTVVGLKERVDDGLKGALLDEECKECTIAPMCPTCYGMNLIETGALQKRDVMHCKFSKVRARAAAYLVAEMIANRERDYVYLRNKSRAEMYDLVRSVRTLNNEKEL
jgi:radical SAM protein with 4Fe4S-binding SPASM domain